MECKNHEDCRATRADELAAQDRTLEAVQLHREKSPVPCRKWWNIDDVHDGDGLRPYVVLVMRMGHRVVPVDFCQNEDEARNRAQAQAIRDEHGPRRIAIVHALAEPELVAELVC